MRGLVLAMLSVLSVGSIGEGSCGHRMLALRVARVKSSQAVFRSIPIRSDRFGYASSPVVIMSAADFTCPPVRMQGLNEGPPWALESVNVSRLLDIEFVQAVDAVVKLQHDLRVEPWTLLRMLQYLSLRKCAEASYRCSAGRST